MRMVLFTQADQLLEILGVKVFRPLNHLQNPIDHTQFAGVEVTRGLGDGLSSGVEGTGVGICQTFVRTRQMHSFSVCTWSVSHVIHSFDTHFLIIQT
jgi:hypothetical protein